VISWLNSVTYYTAFTEGWALYAENPLIAEDTDTYKYEPMQNFRKAEVAGKERVRQSKLSFTHFSSTEEGLILKHSANQPLFGI